jgi:hypothetical protein
VAAAAIHVYIMMLLGELLCWEGCKAAGGMLGVMPAHSITLCGLLLTLLWLVLSSLLVCASAGPVWGGECRRAAPDAAAAAYCTA